MGGGPYATHDVGDQRRETNGTDYLEEGKEATRGLYGPLVHLCQGLRGAHVQVFMFRVDQDHARAGSPLPESITTAGPAAGSPWQSMCIRKPPTSTISPVGGYWAAHFAYQRKIEVIVVRIGAFGHQHDWVQMSADDLGAWAEPEDLCSLLVRCIEAEMAEGPFMIAHGISDNCFKRLDLSDTRNLLGYNPEADAFEAWGIGLHDNSVPRV